MLTVGPSLTDGEMKAWMFANWIPGARVYGSFSEMLTSCQAEVTEKAEEDASKF